MTLFARSRPTDASADVVSSLRAIGDGLRSGLSLRRSIIRAAGPGSSFASLATALAAGAPLAGSLRDAARNAGDADLQAALCVLAVHGDAGGDPIPAVRALADRLTRRASARAEARALTTQARLGTRAMLALTPAFGVLLLATDPRATVASLADPRTRLAVFAGVALQIAGGLWIGAIVRGVASGPGRFGGLPLIRVVRALLAGRARPDLASEVADAAETIAFALDAGLSSSAAITAVAPYTRSRLGSALRRAAADRTVAPHDAIVAALSSFDDAAVERLSRAYSTSALLGVPLAPALRSLADELREQASIRLTEDVRRASIRALVPLGLLVLPAFVLACLVPLFIGGLSGLSS